MMGKYYPIFLDLEGKPCVIVGGGRTAIRKIEGLLACGASVRVIAPHAEERVEALARAGTILLKKRAFRPGDTKNARLVIAATDDPDVNRSVAQDAEQNSALYNVVDAPELCSFFVPATVRRGDKMATVTGHHQSLVAPTGEYFPAAPQGMGTGIHDHRIRLNAVESNQLNGTRTDVKSSGLHFFIISRKASTLVLSCPVSSSP